MPSFLHRNNSNQPDNNGRFHVDCDELVQIYKDFHQRLLDSYYNSAANQKVCLDAIGVLKTTNISCRGKFLSTFTCLIREVYSHIHYNIKELLIDEKEVFRDRLWHEIIVYYDVISTKADKTWQHSNNILDKLSILFHFASLFSLYKDVAQEDFIVGIWERANDWIMDKQERNGNEMELFDSIQTVFRLRHEIRSGIPLPPPILRTRADSSQNNSLAIFSAREEPVTEHQKSININREQLDSTFGNLIGSQEKTKTKRRWIKSRDERVGVEKTEPQATEISEDQNTQPTVDIVISHADEHQTDETIEETIPLNAAEEIITLDSRVQEQTIFMPKVKPVSELPLAAPLPYLPDLSQLLQNLHRVSPSEEQEAAVPVPFDFKADFERRFNVRSRTNSASSNAPVIKPNKEDIVYSYRRQPLFNNPKTSRLRSMVSQCEPEPTENAMRVVGETDKDNRRKSRVSSADPHTYTHGFDYALALYFDGLIRRRVVVIDQRNELKPLRVRTKDERKVCCHNMKTQARSA